MADLVSRQRAPTILNPHEVAGEYDAGRMLTTTLGGSGPRLITHEDIRTFRQNVKTAGKRFRWGITARAVIDMSLEIDRERSNRQIRVAVPVQTLGERIHFITNAGPDSGVTRHHVHIELLNYSAAVASPSKLADASKLLATGPLKFDCDCERHRYYFRYVATIGQYNSGRPETGFPKITNPRLLGVACKHVLRVMQQLSQPAVRIKLEQMIRAGRDQLGHKVIKTSAQEARDIHESQHKASGWKRNKVESSAEKADRLAMQRSAKKVTERSASRTNGGSSTRAKTVSRHLEGRIRKLADTGLLSGSQLAAVLSALKG
jgi:hypothetical protein